MSGQPKTTDNMNKDELSKYLLNRVRELEKDNSQLTTENQRVKNGYTQRVKWLEEKKRSVENENIRNERELRRLKSELERLRTMPLVVGVVQDVLENGKAVVKSSTGPNSCNAPCADTACPGSQF